MGIFNTDHIDQMIARIKAGLPATDDPELERLAEEAILSMETNPVDMTTWAYRLAQSSSKWDD